ncbi:MAG: AAA family ATPase [Solirubrobacteraceae bacterium]
MFGRETERTRIAELVALAAGGPVGVAIEGAAGIGKTTVWRDAVEGATDQGYRVLASAPSEADAALAFSGLGDLFDGLPDELLDGLPDPQRRALGAALFVSDAYAAPDDLDALPRAALSVLRALAADAPVVVAIDDEQWLDRASARVLAFALRRIREERICLLLSRRVDSHGALWADAQRTFASGVEVIELAGLDLTGTHALLAGELTGKIPRRLVERVHQVSGGNPLYVLALGGELKRRHGDGGGERELPIPRTLAAAIAQRLEHVRAGVEAPLFAIAALANPTLAVLGAAIGEFSPGDLDDAAGAGVLEITGETVRFTHPLLASVHYASVQPGDRRELHLCLAAVVPDQEERALHLALGTDTPDSGVAGEIDHAADLAARRGAPEAAAELLEHAIRLTPVDQDQARWARTVTAAERHLAAGDFVAARRLLEQLLLERPDSRTSARARLLLALVRRDDFEFAVWMLEQALADAGEDDRLITEIEMVFQEWCINLGDYAGTVRHAEAALASAERLGEPGPLASALAALAGRDSSADSRSRTICSSGPSNSSMRSATRSRPSTFRARCTARTCGTTTTSTQRDPCWKQPSRERAAEAKMPGRSRHGSCALPSSSGGRQTGARRTDTSPRRPRGRASRWMMRSIRGSLTSRARSPLPAANWRARALRLTRRSRLPSEIATNSCSVTPRY